MGFIKKQGIGFYLTILTIILAAVGLMFYLINCNTAYFSNVGMDRGIVLGVVVALILQAVFIIGSESVGSKYYLDIFPVVSSMLLGFAFIVFVNIRVASIATIMTFENNAQTMADLSSALIGMGCLLMAWIIGMVASFFTVVKE
jgi:hypothetical protein